jgi:hypothetical protein
LARIRRRHVYGETVHCPQSLQTKSRDSVGGSAV